LRCRCGSVFHRVHPSRNVCSCGAVYNGSGELVHGEPIEPSVQKQRKEHNIDLREYKFKNKPGTALESLIPKWAIQNSQQCSCASMKARMDKMGTQWCIDQSDMLIEHLIQQSDKLIPIFRGLPDSFRRASAKKLLAKAIAMSQK